jgi:hypothetical protein
METEVMKVYDESREMSRRRVVDDRSTTLYVSVHLVAQ